MFFLIQKLLELVSFGFSIKYFAFRQIFEVRMP